MAEASQAPLSVALLGDGELPRAVALALERVHVSVRRLRRPSDREVAQLAEAQIDVVLVVSRDDIQALRLALLAEHARPGMPLVVTMFDRTVAEQLRAAVPGCRVLSLADVVAPTLAAPCLADQLISLLADERGYLAVCPGPDGPQLRRLGRRAHAGQRAGTLQRFLPHPFDASARFLLAGLAGFALILAADFAMGVLRLGESPVTAVYQAVKVLVTVGPNPAVESSSAALVRLTAAALMLLGVAVSAILTAGIVNRLLDARLTGILGWRAVPRRGHVIVVGLGQVGLHLCILLRELRVPVVAVERRADAPLLWLARHHRIPVVIGSGGDRILLSRLHLRRARALAAVTSDDLQNIAAAVAALAINRGMRVVLRAGDGSVTAETQALFAIGIIRDAHRIAADLLAAIALGHPAIGAIPDRHSTWIATAQVDGRPRLQPLEALSVRSPRPPDTTSSP